MRIVIGIPSPERVSPAFALETIPNILATTKAAHPDWTIHVSSRTGVGTHLNRNGILQEVEERYPDTDFILWLDADMVYPHDILLRYLDDSAKLGLDVKIMGCVYHRRSPPYSTNVFVDAKNPEAPFLPIPPHALKDTHIYDGVPGFGPIVGLGFGGMLVSFEVYRTLGEDRWMHYGKHFGIPGKHDENWSHDLVFCDKARKAGYSLYVHGGVRPHHLQEVKIGVQDWEREMRKTPLKSLPPVAVLLPATDLDLAQRTAKVMKTRAGAPCEVFVLEDTNRKGYVHTINTAYRTLPETYPYVVYTAQDAFVGQNWLYHALVEKLIYSAGLVALNDGKWDGALASFGLVDRHFLAHIYPHGQLFHDGYTSHYGDTELSVIAQAHGLFAYAKDAIMLEIDYHKAVGNGRGVYPADKHLFAKRKRTGFDGVVSTTHEALTRFA